ncbi:MAG TPA: tRNA (adenosine(37)-N6)-threonylcarbamoyltransferase complex ATPase subunit type 1 TsaE [Thermoanaerobaculia bacterium]|nr:tRNA (adenosine(37)-N6)-threonylcarbamoyltransferase complex ATPase subunit type 1 TsaE [Thermoanaerobaculia bacterium]
MSRNEEETLDLGVALAGELAPDGILLLSGDLGSGKTVLARGVARGLGIGPREVQSPTFTLVREHRGDGGTLIHADLYRLDPAEAASLGLEELLAGPGVKVVEWAERLPFPVAGAVELRLNRLPDGSREIVQILQP